MLYLVIYYSVPSEATAFLVPYVIEKLKEDA